MNLQRAAEIQVLLEGVSLPASRDELVRYARAEDAAAALALEGIPDRDYTRLDEVGEALAPTQPRPPAAQPLPRPESDQPPGGDAYTQPYPESGRVTAGAPPGNPPQQAIEKQSQQQKEQADRLSS
jgi:hypothetical protein